MSIFALVSQSLRTGQPLHEIYPTALFERMLYHHGQTTASTKDVDIESNEKRLERLQSPEFMYYATCIAAMSQLVTVRNCASCLKADC